MSTRWIDQKLFFEKVLFSSLVLLSFGLNTACGQKSMTALNEPSSSSSQSTSATATPELSSAWNQIDLNGQVDGGILSSKSLISLNTTDQTLVVRLPFGSLPLNGFSGYSYQPPEIPGSSVGFIQDGTDWYIGLKVPLKAIVRGVSLGDPVRLPNGNPLPGIPSGEMPGLGINIDRGLPVHIYMGLNVVAAFVELPVTDKYMDYLNYLPFQLKFDIKNKKKEAIGVLAPIAPIKFGGVVRYSGGFYVAAKIPASVARLIDSLL